MTLAELALVTRAAERVAQYNLELNRLRRLRRALEASPDRDDHELIPQVNARLQEIASWVAKLEASPQHVECITLDCGCPALAEGS